MRRDMRKGFPETSELESEGGVGVFQTDKSQGYTFKIMEANYSKALK